MQPNDTQHFLDIKGDFSNVTTSAINDALKDARINYTVSRWITTMLENRFIHAKWGGLNIVKKSMKSEN